MENDLALLWCLHVVPTTHEYIPDHKNLFETDNAMRYAYKKGSQQRLTPFFV